MNLENWLERISALHPTEIDLGLDRVRKVAQSLQLLQLPGAVVTIAGTNGKGSTVTALEALLSASSSSFGSYTSPHLHSYEERIRINGSPVAAEQICQAFAAIEKARGDTSLSYFEFSTLAALYLFKKEKVAVALLEVGLGGRLDAVNIIDSDIAIITSIGMDHMDWLGDSIDQIALEKAAVCRAGNPVLLGQKELPQVLYDFIDQLGANSLQIGKDYDYLDGVGDSWNWVGQDALGRAQELGPLPQPQLDLFNVATAVQAAYLLGLEPTVEVAAAKLSALSLAGRFEVCEDRSTAVPVILDVAHNAAAMENLATKLAKYRRGMKKEGRVILLLAILADKDAESIGRSLESSVDIWYISQVAQERAMSVVELAARLDSQRVRKGEIEANKLRQHPDIQQAYAAACQEASRDDVVVVCGSFVTVAELRTNTSATQEGRL